MPRHGMTLSRHQDKLLHTPATLETLGSTSAVLPTTPAFWKRDDDTIPLARTTMWLNEETVQWLAKTGEWYPPELRSEIQPRIEACRGYQQPRKQPPVPPKPNRWQEIKRPTTQETTEPPAQMPRTSQALPQQEAKKETHYMKLQRKFAEIAADLPTGSIQVRQTQASASGSQPQPPASQPQDTSTLTKTTEPQKSSNKVAKVSAEALTERRPEPPASTATSTPKVDAP